MPFVIRLSYRDGSEADLHVKGDQVLQVYDERIDAGGGQEVAGIIASATLTDVVDVEYVKVQADPVTSLPEGIPTSEPDLAAAAADV